MLVASGVRDLDKRSPEPTIFGEWEKIGRSVR